MFSRLRSCKLSPFHLPNRMTLGFVLAVRDWLQRCSESLPGCVCWNRKLLVISVSLYFISTRNVAEMCFCGALRAWRAVAPQLSCLLWQWAEWCWQGRDWNWDLRGLKNSSNISKTNQNFCFSEVQWVQKGKFKKSKGEVLLCFGVLYANRSSFLFQCCSAL